MFHVFKEARSTYRKRGLWDCDKHLFQGGTISPDPSPRSTPRPHVHFAFWPPAALISPSSRVHKRRAGAMNLFPQAHEGCCG
jgi:hypothetical protein